MTRWCGRFAAAVGAWAWTVNPVHAQSAAQLEQLEAAFAGQDLEQAAELLSDLVIVRRPADGALRSDPLLNGLFGRLYFDQGYASVALPYLQRSVAAEVPPIQRVEAQLALAEAQDLTGDSAAAARTLASLDSDDLPAGQRRRVILGRADLMLRDDPAGALALVQPLLSAGDAGIRFEAELLGSRAQAMLGNRSAAVAAGERAWSLAMTQPPHRVAPLRAALVLAGLAAKAADRERLIAMLNAAGSAQATLDHTLVSQLPMCGEDGLRPTDEVTFAVYVSGAVRQRLEPVSASRPAAVAPFFRALAGRRLLDQLRNQPVGTVFTVRCRTLPSAERSPPSGADTYAQIFAENGIYVPSSTDWNTDRIAVVESEIAEIERRFGRDHPFLVPLLGELAQRVEQRVQSSRTGSATEVTAIQWRMAAAMRRLPGAESFVPSDEEFRLMESAVTPEMALQRWRAAWRDRIERAGPDLAYQLTLEWLRNDTELPGEDAIGLIRNILGRLDSRPADPRRQALLMRLGRLQLDRGDDAGARASYRSAGVGEEACLARYLGLDFVSGEITPEAYPRWARRYEFHGATNVEFGIGADGRVERQRVILSAPASLFDEATTTAFAPYRYGPNRPSGRAQACTANLQSFIWRMPDENERRMPEFDLFGADPA